jgi:hypothetical protein
MSNIKRRHNEHPSYSDCIGMKNSYKILGKQQQKKIEIRKVYDSIKLRWLS